MTISPISLANATGFWAGEAYKIVKKDLSASDTSTIGAIADEVNTKIAQGTDFATAIYTATKDQMGMTTGKDDFLNTLVNAAKYTYDGVTGTTADFVSNLKSGANGGALAVTNIAQQRENNNAAAFASAVKKNSGDTSALTDAELKDVQSDLDAGDSLKDVANKFAGRLGRAQNYTDSSANQLAASTLADSFNVSKSTVKGSNDTSGSLTKTNLIDMLNNAYYNSQNADSLVFGKSTTTATTDDDDETNSTNTTTTATTTKATTDDDSLTLSSLNIDSLSKKTLVSLLKKLLGIS